MTLACMATHDVAVFSNKKPFSSGRTRLLSIYMEYARQAVHALLQRRGFDCYVFLEPQIGLLYAFISRVLHLEPPTLILINFIPREQKGMKWLIDAFYRFSLGRITALSVSSRGLMDKYKTRFRMTARQFFIPDAIHFYRAEPCAEENFIFSGGYSHRDWPTLLDAASSLPGFKFIVCATRKDRNIFNQCHHDNVMIEYDVSTNQFYNVLNRQH